MGRILVVEDSRTQAEFLSLVLGGAGYEVVCATDARQALELLQAGPFDLVLSDVLMADLDGYELCRLIKKNPATARLPVVLLTQLSDPLDILRGVECGADNYLTKPVDAPVLLRRLHTLFDSRVRRTDAKVSLGVQVTFLDQTFTITSEKEQILDLLIATCEDIVRTNGRLRASQAELEKAKLQVEHYARRVEAQARTTADKYRRLMEEASDVILLTDVRGRVLEANRRVEALLGIPSAQLVGQRLEDYVHEEERDSERAQLRATLARGSSRLDNLRLRRADGQTVWVDFSASEVELDNERIVLTILHDATERNRLERQLRQSQKLEAVGRLAGGVAHDFNNLLTVINGYSELSLNELAAEHPVRDMVEMIRKAGDRAAGLTRQLLAFSRQQVISPRVLDLNHVVTEMGRLLKRLIGEDVELTTVLCPTLGAIRADPGQVEQVLLNLAVNARDAMPRGGKLTIETSNVELDANNVQLRPETRPGPYVLLAVSDTGVGMDEATLGKVFEPFFTTKEQGKGTGLGLATVYGIVRQAEGHIYAYSEPGRGACFKVYWPRVSETPARTETPEAVPELRGSETILLVEDEDAVRALTREVLTVRGYTVLEAAHSAEALRQAETHAGPIHLLLTDVVMPGIGGRELAERLYVVRPEMKVLYVSGYADDAVVRHGVLSSEVAFLQKPYSVEALMRRVRAVLEPPVNPS